jgi:hypothetical protein
MDELRLDQCLYGYESGHSLLASSTQLPAEVRRQLLTLTDYPGTYGADPSVEGHVAGYPLVNGQMYVLSRTWLAPEMPRPGCVFTHVLLFDMTAVHEIEDPRSVLRLFHRPSRDDYSSFSRIMVVQRREMAWPEIPEPGRVQLMSALLDELYGRQDPLVVRLPKWEDLAQDVLAVWGQQWPALRTRFAFATGGSSARAIGGTPFDLQITSVFGSSAYSNRNVVLLDSSHPASVTTQDENPWATTLARSIYLGEGDSFRDFARRYGADVGSTRLALGRLAKIFAVLTAPIPTSIKTAQVFNRATDLFPEPAEAALLKRHLFGSAAHRHAPLGFVCSEPELLRVMVLNPAAAAMAGVNSDELGQRLAALTTEEPSIGIRLLAEVTGKDARAAAAAAKILYKDESFIEALLSASNLTDQEMLAVLTLDPSLATNHQLWRHEGAGIERVIALVEELGPDKLRGIIAGAFSAGNRAALNILIERDPKTAVLGILDAVQADPALIESVPPNLSWNVAGPAWITGVTPPRAEVLQLLAGKLDPHIGALRRLGWHPWISLCSEVFIGSPDLQTSSAAFLFVLGLTGSSRDWMPLVTAGFQVLHRVEAGERLTEQEWSRVEPSIVPARFWGDWDRCRRLRATFARFSVRQRAPIDLFLAGAEHTDRRAVLEEASAQRGGKAYVAQTGIAQPLPRANDATDENQG